MASLAIALTIAEVGLRVFTIRPKLPGVLTTESGEPGDMNPLFLHSCTGHLPEDPNCVRISFLGDSYVYGLSVDKDETLVHQARLLLQDRWTKRCAVFNCGQVGGDLVSEWIKLNHTIDLFRPHVVVHVLSSNDLDVDQPRNLDRILQVVGAEPLWLSQHLALVHLVEARIREAVAKRLYLDYVRGGATPGSRARAWSIAAHEIAATKALCERHGASYVLVRFPEIVFGMHDYPLEDVHRQTLELAKRLDVKYLDLLNRFRGCDNGDLTQQPFDPFHPSPKAHRIAAEAISEFLLTRVLPHISVGRPMHSAKARSTEEVKAATMQHLEELLSFDPTCQSAHSWQQFVIQQEPRPATAPSQGDAWRQND